MNIVLTRQTFKKFLQKEKFALFHKALLMKAGSVSSAGNPSKCRDCITRQFYYGPFSSSGLKSTVFFFPFLSSSISLEEEKKNTSSFIQIGFYFKMRVTANPWSPRSASLPENSVSWSLMAPFRDWPWTVGTSSQSGPPCPTWSRSPPRLSHQQVLWCPSDIL